MQEVEAGRFSVDAQGRIWRHILNNAPAEPQRAEYRLNSGFLRVLWHDGRCYRVRARNTVWRYFYGPVPEDAIVVHKNACAAITVPRTWKPPSRSEGDRSGIA